MFGVTTSSMKKHADKIAEIMEDIAEKSIGDEDFASSFVYPVGTDPWVTERINWEMYCKMSRMDLET